MTGKQLHELIELLIKNFEWADLYHSEEDFKDYAIKEIALMIFKNMSKDEKNNPIIDYSEDEITSEIKIKNKKGKIVMTIPFGWNESQQDDFYTSDWINIIQEGAIQFCEHCGMWKTEKYWTKRAENGNIVLCDDCED